MANTNALKEVSEFAVSKAAEILNVDLSRKKVRIGTANKEKTFDGVSSKADIVVKVLNHSGITSGGNNPSAKIRSTFADCYFLSLTKAKKKIIALTNREFYNIFENESYGLLNEIELMYIELPDRYRTIAQEVSNQASKEMSKS